MILVLLVLAGCGSASRCHPAGRRGPLRRGRQASRPRLAVPSARPRRRLSACGIIAKMAEESTTPDLLANLRVIFKASTPRDWAIWVDRANALAAHGLEE